ncbi:Uncharacterised protein [Starkeya nomas]|uniref:Uncharacterized protein n=2 Tax=Xanthobacteraceae TaxID=335928 RepID=A0A5S9N8W5_9HYPH|nr:MULTISPECIES: hypothetical protein [Xanthobacteraceae]TSJ60889.1 hypothetical protein FO470_15115 [Ancylobacter moscoviensis]CAA0086490.1 Uncharacterised protein [Starkeya nomas]
MKKTLLAMTALALWAAAPALAQDTNAPPAPQPPLSNPDNLDPGPDAPQPLTGELVPRPGAPPVDPAADLKLPNCTPPNCGTPQIMSE